MRGFPPLLLATVAAFALGAGLMLSSTHPVTLALGVLLLFAFVVLGVFLIASPAYLERGSERESEEAG